MTTKFSEAQCIKNIYFKFHKKLSQIPGQCDAESVESLDNFLINIDEISVHDGFLENDGYSLGWNVAVASLSDIFASGGRPYYIAHSLTISEIWTEDYFDKFTSGLTDLFNYLSITLTSGDICISKHWSYTACVIGKPIKKSLNRIGCIPGDYIYLSGKVGDGNIMAYLKNFFLNLKSDSLIKFSPPTHNLDIISEYADTCIDTSDGLIKSIEIIMALNDLGAEIDNIQYNEKLFNIIKDDFNYPKILLALAGAGEYQLLFSVKRSKKDTLDKLIKAHNLDIQCIGKFNNKNTLNITEMNKTYNINLQTFNKVLDLKEESTDKYISNLLLSIEPH